MKLKLVHATLVLVISGFASAQTTAGSVCVASRVDDPFWKESATLPDGRINSHGLRFRVDKTAATPWPGRKPLKVEGLDLDKRHLLVVLGADGKPIESVKFKFSDYKSIKLCMAYDGYQGISLQEATRRTPWCKCR